MLTWFRFRSTRVIARDPKGHPASAAGDGLAAHVVRPLPRCRSHCLSGIVNADCSYCLLSYSASKSQNLEGLYASLLTQTSPHEKSIGRDLGRTFPKHDYFIDPAGAGQEQLFNVVKAYSIHDEEVGYTQGLQFVVGPLLLNVS